MNKTTVIRIDTDGEITTPRLVGDADPDHPGGRFWHLRELIDSRYLHGITVPNSDLVAWTCALEHQQTRPVNLIASELLNQLGCPGPLVDGPLVFTGGNLAEPLPLSAFQVVKTLNRLDLKPQQGLLIPLLRNTLAWTGGLGRRAPRL